MKKLLASALFLLIPLSAHAACSASDFTVENFKMKPAGGSGSALRLSLSGQLVNHCAQAAAAQVRIEAKDSTGGVVQSKQGWPAGTSNIAPGQSVDFDLGRLFRYQSEMQNFTVSVADVRTW